MPRCFFVEKIVAMLLIFLLSGLLNDNIVYATTGFPSTVTDKAGRTWYKGNDLTSSNGTYDNCGYYTCIGYADWYSGRSMANITAEFENGTYYGMMPMVNHYTLDTLHNTYYGDYWLQDEFDTNLNSDYAMHCRDGYWTEGQSKHISLAIISVIRVWEAPESYITRHPIEYKYYDRAGTQINNSQVTNNNPCIWI